MRRTRIVATLGPASVDPQILRTMIYSGVDVFRFNFSHGTHETHKAAAEAVREACAECGREVALLQDLCGPKIRCGVMENDCVELAPGQDTVITTQQITGTAACFSCSYKDLPKDATPGDRILLNDGMLELEVLATAGNEVRCRVVHGGKLKSHKGINLPGMKLSTPAVTSKDMKDLAAGLDIGVDFVALSFVRYADDVMKVRKVLDKQENPPALIVKIEKPEALDNIQSIMEVCDGIMVARGDLGVEMPMQRVPIIQKELIRLAHSYDKMVITATQMLESMVENPVPTRAEVSDVANAIYDGTDAVMLSAESAAGDYPVESVQALHDIAIEIENFLADHRPHWDWDRICGNHPLGDAVGDAAYWLCEDLQAKAIVAYSSSGRTALYLSKSRPFAPIIVFTANRTTARRMRLYWGVEPIYCPDIHSSKDLRYYASEHLRENSLVNGNDPVVIITGSPFGAVDHSNTLEVMQLSGELPVLKVNGKKRGRK